MWTCGGIGEKIIIPKLFLITTIATAPLTEIFWAFSSVSASLLISW
jgi:hypothetical protein